jgi:hypothetical protein
VAALRPQGLTPLQPDAFADPEHPRPQLTRHTRLFGARIRSPLAHLDGGEDRNGPPDVPPPPPPPEAAGAADGGAAPASAAAASGAGVGEEEGAPLSPSPLPAAHAAQLRRGRVRPPGFMADLLARPSPPRSPRPSRPPPSPAVPVPADGHLAGLPEGVAAVPAPRAGMSCDEVCAGAGGGGGGPGGVRGAGAGAGAGGGPVLSPSAGRKGHCSTRALAAVNTCAALRAYFPCANGCDDSAGGDQPAYIHEAAPRDKLAGTCLVNSDPALFSCAGRYTHAIRLCACVQPLTR